MNKIGHKFTLHSVAGDLERGNPAILQRVRHVGHLVMQQHWPTLSRTCAKRETARCDVVKALFRGDEIALEAEEQDAFIFMLQHEEGVLTHAKKVCKRQ